MDPATTIILVTFMMLLNGGLLGLMHSDLPESLRPSAASWRIGTLLVAAGSILLAVQRSFPAGFILPLGNLFLTLGIMGYWRALRQFDNRPDRLWMLLPPIVTVLGVWWFAAVTPSLSARSALISIVWAVMMLGCIVTLKRFAASESSTSRKTLMGIFFVMMVFMLARCGYFLTVHLADKTVLDTGNWMNMVTPVILAVLPVTGTTAYLLLCSDLIRRQWEHAASTDALTGLANRRTLARVASEKLSHARQSGAGFAIAIIDIDHFKSINDRFGHDVGDAALKFVATTISMARPNGAFLCRQGGEEFVALLAVNSEQRALVDGEQLRAALHAHAFPAPGGNMTITVSIGLALLRAGEMSLDDALRRADQALYQAKSGGRDRVVFAAS
jgi:diguanylate cyclase (GGDEF)-like protein